MDLRLGIGWCEGEGMDNYKEGAYLVSEDLRLSVVLEVTVPLEPAFYDLAKFDCKGLVIEQMVNAES